MIRNFRVISKFIFFIIAAKILFFYQKMHSILIINKNLSVSV
ncbi:hypothetical protein HMPREF1551_01391 [Capnocytophaga sp. oral taxon 863 str. F0517]|nr:hypothetical protein HMPREF1551_01391 [Capnocytophaga sp. oral taxon 863 str. F0517]